MYVYAEFNKPDQDKLWSAYVSAEADDASDDLYIEADDLESLWAGLGQNMPRLLKDLPEEEQHWSLIVGGHVFDEMTRDKPKPRLSIVR